MTKKATVKMDLGTFLGPHAAAASQPVKGKILPSGPDPHRDPDERRGPGGRRYGDDNNGSAARSEGSDNWRRMTPSRVDDGPWRRHDPLPRSGGGFDRGGSGGRESGYPDPSGDSPSPAVRRPLPLKSRTTPPPLPPMTPKESAAAASTIAPTPKPSGPRSNPFGAAHAVDTTQRDREIEAKARAFRPGTFRRDGESSRPSLLAGKAEAAAEESERAAPEPDSNTASDVQASANQTTETIARHIETTPDGTSAPGGDGDRTMAGRTDGTGNEVNKQMADEPTVPPKPVRRWAPRRDSGGENRAESSTGSFPRRDRDEDRRDGGMGRSNLDGRTRGDRHFGRRDEGASGFGSRMERERMLPPAPPTCSAFAKRFGSNFDRDSDRVYRRGAVGMGGNYDRRDNERRGSGGGYERRDERKIEGGGAVGGNSRFTRDEHSQGHQRQTVPAPSVERPLPHDGDSIQSSTEQLASSLSNMSIVNPEKSEPVAQLEAAPAMNAEHEPQTEVAEEPRPESEQSEDMAEVARTSAAEAMATGKRGTDLREFVQEQEKKTTARALVAAALENNDTPQDMKWAAEDEFGAAVMALSAGKKEEQIGIIYAVVAKCLELGFPKVEGQGLVQVLFSGMYHGDICEEDAFLDWKDDVDNPAPGRTKAILQSTSWLAWLESVEEEEED